MSEDNSGAARKPTRNIPPLAWVIVALALVAAVIGFAQYGGTHKTPGGGETPMDQSATTGEAQQSQATIPAR